MGYVSESNSCCSRCMMNDTKEIKAAFEWYRDWNKSSGIAENYHLIFCKDPPKCSEVWGVLLTQNLKEFNHWSKTYSVCNSNIMIITKIIIIIIIIIIITIIMLAVTVFHIVLFSKIIKLSRNKSKLHFTQSTYKGMFCILWRLQFFSILACSSV